MKRIIYILLIVLFSSCEKIIDFNDTTMENKLVLNAIVQPDTSFSVAIFNSLCYDAVNTNDQTWAWGIYTPYGDTLSVTDFLYVTDAEASIEVNGGVEYKLLYDTSDKVYKCSYIPVEGDVVTIKASNKSTSVSAKAEIPARVELDVCSCNKLYDKKGGAIEYNGLKLIDLGAADTIMQVNLKIKDPAKVKNYYRLKVRSVAEYSAKGKTEYNNSDLFSSSDVIFSDERLSKRYWELPAYFSNVFTDYMFNGHDYSFTVTARQRHGDNPMLYIQLQSITKEFYYYLKSVELYRITDRDSYTESIQIYSDVNNGLGIFGGLSGKTLCVKFK